MMLVAAALGISIYLSTHSSFGTTLLGCGPDSGCDKVLGSVWSHLGPIPVSWLAVLLETLWLVALALGNPGAREATVADTAASFCASAALASAVWFTILQAAVLHAVCPYCMAGHFCASLAALLQWRCSGFAGLKRTSAYGVAAAMGLVAAQLTLPTKTSVVESLGGEGQAETNPPTIKPTVSLYGGAFQLDPEALPRMGSPTAPRHVISLFDYTCHICRDLHHLLEGQLLKYPGEFQIVNLVMPLCADCNPLMRETSPAHVNACHFARLGLAVFRASPEKSAEFDTYLFEGAKPPPLEQAKAKAAHMVGAPALAKALDDPWIAQRIEENVRLYKSNYFKIRRGEMPQLMIGDAISVGAIREEKQFGQFLEQQWGLVARTNQPSDSPVRSAH